MSNTINNLNKFILATTFDAATKNDLASSGIVSMLSYLYLWNEQRIEIGISNGINLILVTLK